MLNFKSCGLDYVWLASGYASTETSYGIAHSYTDIQGLYHGIAYELCTGNYPLNGREIRFIRKQLKLTQEELGKKLGFQGQTVAKWEKGQSRVSKAISDIARLHFLTALNPAMKLDQAMHKHLIRDDMKLIMRYSPIYGWYGNDLQKISLDHNFESLEDQYLIACTDARSSSYIRTITDNIENYLPLFNLQMDDHKALGAIYIQPESFKITSH